MYRDAINPSAELRKWLVTNIVNPYRLIPADAPKLITAIMTDDWDPVVGDKWRWVYSQWLNQARLTELAEYSYTVHSYSKIRGILPS